MFFFYKKNIQNKLFGLMADPRAIPFSHCFFPATLIEGYQASDPGFRNRKGH